MSRYTYSPLLPGPDSIRLLRLIPHKDEAAPIQCRLMNYTLQASIRKPCPYEALSYVWGDTNESLSISIDNFHFSVTINLFAALSRLRDRDFERIIWVDAICINQKDDKEKESQIQFMAKIYSQASNVIVWLGEAAENSDRALEDIRVAAAYKLTNSLFHKNSERSILRLLERPWFHRIWVLQEVAAARHVLMICGSAEIDGHAFCLGLDALKRMYEARPDFEGMIRSVIYLIRGAIFRPRHWAHGVGRSSLHISSLGELIDMYHAHKATKRHDKLYALIGMCSDDLSEGGLLPNYELPWEELFQRLVKFIIHQGVWVKTWGDGAMALIKSKACILGKVSISMDSAREEGVAMDITFNHLPEQTKYTKEWTTRWNLHTSAKSIKNGDVICLLQGASKPTIVRLYEDYCAIIVIAVTLPEDTRIDNKWQDLAQSNDLFICDLLLVWDWTRPAVDPGNSKCNRFMQTYHQVPEDLRSEIEGDLARATRIWDMGLIKGDLGDGTEAEESIREAIQAYEEKFQVKSSFTPASVFGLTPLSWSAGNGHTMIVKVLLTKCGVSINIKDSLNGQTPLYRAAKNGHPAVVRSLLQMAKVDFNSKNEYGFTSLSRAAENGHDAVVKLLLENGEIEVDSKDKNGKTPLYHAAKNGHQAVVRSLLQTVKVDVNSKNERGWTPISRAAENGHDAIVKLLLEDGEVEVDSKDTNGWTPLMCAAENGHETIVKLLLKTGKAEVESKDENYGRTSLWLAAGNGHAGVVRLLLESGETEVDRQDEYFGQTPLSWAAGNGEHIVVKLLLGTGRVDVNMKDEDGRTALSWAAEFGHYGIVESLLETGKVKFNLEQDNYGRTAIWRAKRNGHNAIVELLLASGGSN